MKKERTSSTIAKESRNCYKMLVSYTERQVICMLDSILSQIGSMKINYQLGFEYEYTCLQYRMWDEILFISLVE